MNKEKKIPGHILSLFIILLSISGVCLLMYKAQFRFNLHQPIEYVMMTTHKPTGTITLSSDSPVLTETFTCTVPELKMFTLEGTAKIKIPMPAFSSLWQMQIPEKFIIRQNTHFPFSEQQKRKN